MIREALQPLPKTYFLDTSSKNCANFPVTYNLKGVKVRKTAITIMVVILLGLAAYGFAQSEDGVRRMELQEFKSLYSEGSVVVVDTRGQGSYDEGHIPGAIPMPLDLSELSGVTKPIVTYCS